MRSIRQVFVLLTVVVVMASLFPSSSAQTRSANKRRQGKAGSHSSPPRVTMTPEARLLLEQAMDAVCTQQKLDPQSNIPIDEMQGRPSLPIHSPEAQEGLARADRVLPLAKTLMISALQQLAVEYGFRSSYNLRIQQAIARVRSVTRVRPDVDSRDNASVFLTRPRTITFGTIFLSGLRSDEGMIGVLAHELMHIADGNADTLRALVSAVSQKASALTGIDIRGQRAEELACDLIGAMAVRAYVADSPSYESVTRRLARSVEHNCVDVDEGDDDHLSPRNTIRALLAVNPLLVRELVFNRQERIQTRPTRDNPDR